MPPRAHATFALATALAALLGCSSTPKPEPRPRTIDVHDIDRPMGETPPDPIGKYLADLDVAMRHWTTLTLTARDDKERVEARVLEQHLQARTNRRLSELIEQLQTGPPMNRVRAAAAVGFSRSPEALSPLLGALQDPKPDVVHNALLGLALLEHPDTPLELVCAILAASPDPQTRSNAAYAMRCIVAKGGSAECVVPAARQALVDSEPFVRAQAALIAGLAGDGESVQALADMVQDESRLVATAAIEALKEIGLRSDRDRGRAARALAAALVRGDKHLRPNVLRALTRLSTTNYGDDQDEWVRWAARLP
ncbi:MAG TPA: HEAT repeat domain-containing protein [Planctomycetota bacterium]|nr:HEAT repeat domain-containing protein [Planctomycetota bacterium]